MASEGPLYLGFDLSTQQLKGLVVDSQLRLIHEAKVDFDEDLGTKYGIHKGVLSNPAEGEVFAPVSLWLDAVDLVLDRLQKLGLAFPRVKGISGAGMQHGTVFWSNAAESILANLDPSNPLAQQLAPEGLTHEHTPQGAFAHPMSPNWQDASTQAQCDQFDQALGTPETLAEVTGSKAHHRFSGPQIMRYRTKYPSHYDITSRISLVSSFLASLFLGRIAPIDISDVTGMNLWDIQNGTWHETLLTLTAGGSSSSAATLRTKLGDVPTDGGASFGPISPYFQHRYSFPADCQIIPFTGDNPATILSLPLQDSDAMVSLGTSTTFLMSTQRYLPDPAYHFMHHPTTRGSYMFMLCYKNGGLAREHVRDALSPSDWPTFTSTALATPPLNQSSPADPMHLGLYFPRPEIVPNLPAGQWRYTYTPATQTLTPTSSTASHPPPYTKSDARLIIESQMLSLRLRSHRLVKPQVHPTHQTPLPPQPRRVYLVGGGSANPAIATVAGQTLGSADGIYRLEIGGNACALGAAYKAVWGCERSGPEEGFEEVIGKRWDEGKFVKRVAEGYVSGLWETYGVATEGFERMEREVVEREGGKK